MAGIFYLPRATWKYLEGGIINRICKAKVKEEDAEETTTMVANHLVEKKGRSQWHLYAFYYIFCHLLGPLFVLIHFWLGNVILGNEYLYLAEDLAIYHMPEVFASELYRYVRQEANIFQTELDDTKLYMDPLKLRFPLTASCTLRIHGPSHTLQTFNAICALPLNKLNRVIFVTLILVYLVLLLCSMIHALRSIPLLIFPCTRRHRLQRRCLKPRTAKEMNSLINTLCLGQLLVVLQLSENMQGMDFDNLISELISLAEGADDDTGSNMTDTV